MFTWNFIEINRFASLQVYICRIQLTSPARAQVSVLVYSAYRGVFGPFSKVLIESLRRYKCYSPEPESPAVPDVRTNNTPVTIVVRVIIIKLSFRVLYSNYHLHTIIMSEW